MADIVDLGTWKRQEIIEECLSVLQRKQLLIFPTDTVYGILGPYQNYQAVKAIYTMKKRAFNQPLILLGNKLEQLQPFIQIPLKYQELVNKLAFKFWPGALTLILPKTSKVPRYLNANKSSIGIRVPAHDLLLELLAEWGEPLASTSANQSGLPPVDRAINAQEQFQHIEEVGLYIEQGLLESNTPSTIIDLTGAKPYIIRQGSLGLELELDD